MPDSRDLVTDPILTAFSLAYPPEDVIGEMVLPRVPVRSLDGRYFSFSPGDSLRARDTRKRPNGEFHEVEHTADDAATFSLDEHGLEEFIPDIEREDFATRSQGVVDLRTSTVDNLTWEIMNSREKRVANLVQDAAQFDSEHKKTLSGANQWDDDSSDPQEEIEVAKTKTLFIPNVMVLSYDVFQILKRHPGIRDTFKYVSRESITADMLAKLFELDAVFVGKAQEATNNPGQTDVFARIWTDSVLLARIDQSPGLKSRTFGFSPEMKTRRVLTSRLPRGSGGELIKVVEAVGEKISDARLGFLLIDTLST